MIRKENSFGTSIENNRSEEPAVEGHGSIGRMLHTVFRPLIFLPTVDSIFHHLTLLCASLVKYFSGVVGLPETAGGRPYC